LQKKSSTRRPDLHREGVVKGGLKFPDKKNRKKLQQKKREKTRTVGKNSFFFYPGLGLTRERVFLQKTGGGGWEPPPPRLEQRNAKNPKKKKTNDGKKKRFPPASVLPLGKQHDGAKDLEQGERGAGKGEKGNGGGKEKKSPPQRVFLSSMVWGATKKKGASGKKKIRGKIPSS